MGTKNPVVGEEVRVRSPLNDMSRCELSTHILMYNIAGIRSKYNTGDLRRVWPLTGQIAVT